MEGIVEILTFNNQIAQCKNQDLNRSTPASRGKSVLFMAEHH